jgi:hypothetical protein
MASPSRLSTLTGVVGNGEGVNLLLSSATSFPVQFQTEIGTPKLKRHIKISHVRQVYYIHNNHNVGVSRLGSLDRRVKYRRVPQSRWVGARRSAKGGKAARERERWKSRGLRVYPAPRSGALTVGGYKRPRGRGSERPHASACPVLFPARPTLCKRALVLPFIGARRGSRCTIGV